MTASNHVLTGMLIGTAATTAVANPLLALLLALPMALASHFVLDALPHYSDEYVGYTDFKFKLILLADAYIASMCLLLVYMLGPAHMWTILFSGVIAASPDLMWLPDFIAALRHQPTPVYGKIRQFHHKIQWWAKPKGVIVEAVWFVAAFMLLFYNI